MNQDNGLNTNVENSFKIPEKPKKSKKDQRNFDATLLISYIGKNNKDFFSKKFSFPAFLFGGIYLMYRNMFKFGILIYLIEITLVLIQNNLIILSVILGLILIERIILGLIINKKYLDFAYNDCMKIEEKNNVRPDEEIVTLCKEKGENNVVIAILITILITIVVYSLTSIIKTLI